jgi:hypothetical protein
MLAKLTFSFALALILSLPAFPQRPEVAFTLNEPFFDGLLDSLFQNFDPPEFSLAATNYGLPDDDSSGIARFRGPSVSRADSPASGACTETIKLLRETRGVRTAVRFREGRISVPLAFTGSYSPPLVGCIEFGGWADAELEPAYDQDAGKLNGRIKVAAVNLNGTGGVGGSLIARMLQSSIDKRVNPVEILSLAKVSFTVPVYKNGLLKMQARRVRTEVLPAAFIVRVEYDFLKG